MMKTLNQLDMFDVDKHELRKSAIEDIRLYEERIKQTPHEEEIIRHTIAYIRFKFNIQGDAG